MKNKKLTYLLAFVVLVVWGLIIYRILNTVSSTDDLPDVALQHKTEAYDDYSAPADTTRLQQNYPDPFGLVKPKDTVLKTKIPVQKNNVVKPVKPPVDWGFIHYMGYIRNPGSKKLIAILHINSKEVMMTEGETADQVRLLKNMGDSIKVNYNGKTKFILIKSAAL